MCDCGAFGSAFNSEIDEHEMYKPKGGCLRNYRESLIVGEDYLGGARLLD